MDEGVWPRVIRPLEEWTINMIYHVVKKSGRDVDKTFVDISKSFEREAWRSDEFSPPPPGKMLHAWPDSAYF